MDQYVNIFSTHNSKTTRFMKVKLQQMRKLATKISLLSNVKHKLLFKLQNAKEIKGLKIKGERWSFL